MNPVSFFDALKTVPKAADRRLLLGNGFSQACRKDIFSYGSLLERADFGKLSPYVSKTFGELKTTDFEVVIRALRDASTLLRIYKKDDKELALALKKDAEGIRKVLVETIAKHHPAHPAEIEDDKYKACRRFLNNFNKIYSLNYDMLLYWALMHEDEVDPTPLDIDSDDGFRHPDGEGEVDYVTWDGHPYRQNIFYLHGALHLFEAASELKKFAWKRTGVRLLKQIEDALDSGMYPLIVAEGKSKQKQGRILRSGYLTKGLRSFREAGGALFIYGASLAENDKHILDTIVKSKISRLWISVYGRYDSAENQKFMKYASSFKSLRKASSPLEIGFYDAASAEVWG